MAKRDSDELDDEQVETLYPADGPIRSLADVLGINDPQKPAGEDTPVVDPKLPARMTAKQLSREVLNSKQYRESLLRRIIMGELPPAVECKLMDYAWGRPVEKVQVEDTTRRFEKASIDQLEERALYLAGLAREMRKEQPEATPEAKTAMDDDPETNSIH